MKTATHTAICRIAGPFVLLILLVSSCGTPPRPTTIGEQTSGRTTPATPSPTGRREEPEATATVTATSPSAEEIRLLERTSQAVCTGNSPESLNPAGAILVDGSSFSLTCVYAAGHATRIRIERYEDPETALSAFQSSLGGRTVEDFHGHPSTAWERAFPGPGSEGRTRTFQWQAGRWIVQVTSSDDTAYPISRDPREVSDIIYAEMIGMGFVEGD
ncbi:MAG TPA: hypothetical protein ENK56_09265 [Chloroflexi bacterium]|nr:hypothetical protein [Chloroflexota bacterium]